MRVTPKFTLSFLVVSQFLASPAATWDDLESSGCHHALQGHYGEQFTFTLVSRRNSRQGRIFKVAVRDTSVPEGTWQVHYATCRVARGGDGQVTVEADNANADRSSD